jgi:hypothetical protein
MKQKSWNLIKISIQEIALFIFALIGVILTMIVSVLMAFYLYFEF